MTGTALDLCSGAGGMALGLEQAGFDHVTAVDADPLACNSLRRNRPSWTVKCADLASKHWSDVGAGYFDVVSAGLPSPLRTGFDEFKEPEIDWTDEAATIAYDWSSHDLLTSVLRIVAVVQPRAVLIENIHRMSSAAAVNYRTFVLTTLRRLGYLADWQVLHASEFGLPQERPRFVLIGMRADTFEAFRWPTPNSYSTSVGEALHDLMAENGWTNAPAWAEQAAATGPTLIAGSTSRGGADLGGTWSKRAWSRLGVDGSAIADAAPDRDADVVAPKLTIEMVARLQGFPEGWIVEGSKRDKYRLIGGACPPPLAAAIGRQIYAAIATSRYPSAG